MVPGQWELQGWQLGWGQHVSPLAAPTCRSQRGDVPLLLEGGGRIGLCPMGDKASLRVNPAGGMVPAGGRVSLRCLCQVPCARLFLHRDTGPIPVQHAEAWGQAAEFPINRAGPGDTGTYHCRYLSRYGQPRWSESSDPVRLVVGGESPMCGPLTQSSDAATSGVRFGYRDLHPEWRCSHLWDGAWGLFNSTKQHPKHLGQEVRENPVESAECI
uniref:Immunoglobulin subtype domain-containing protein n=1 Tax=Gopherus evgoodei TaxID=1825980 RepID=A0A8C4YIA3_9SAUR